MGNNPSLASLKGITFPDAMTLCVSQHCLGHRQSVRLTLRSFVARSTRGRPASKMPSRPDCTHSWSRTHGVLLLFSSRPCCLSRSLYQSSEVDLLAKVATLSTLKRL